MKCILPQPYLGFGHLDHLQNIVIKIYLRPVYVAHDFVNLKISHPMADIFYTGVELSETLELL